jgi:hypothetical protein
MMPVDFLSIIHEGLPGLRDVRVIPPDGKASQCLHDTLDSALEAIDQGVRERCNVYVGIAMRRNQNLGGGKANLWAVRLLWIDRDFHSESDRKAHERALAAFPLSPSLRVSSGGGEHDYWLLEEPYSLNTPKAIQALEFALKGLADVLQGDRAATDASRVLRVPGTVNYPNEKKRRQGRKAAPCEVISHEGRLYQWQDFAELEERGRALAERRNADAQHESRPWTGEVPDRVQRVLRRDPRVRARFDRDAAGLEDTSDSGIDMSLAALLAYRRLEGWEIENALRASRACEGAQWKPDDYYTRTVDKALADAQRLREHPAEPQSGALDSSLLVYSPPSGVPDQEGDIPQGWREKLQKLHAVSAEELLEEPEDEHRWLVDGLIPAGGLILLAGKPKAGKSTLARTLAVSLSQGRTWLGRRVQQGPVVYLALEEKPAEVNRQLRSFGIRASDPLAMIFAPPPHVNRLEWFFEVARELRPALIVVDTLQRLLQVPDFNDYAVLSSALEPLLSFSHESGVAILLLHHARKGAGQSFDSILGSNALFGSVDSALLLERTGNDLRLLSSRQRAGTDLPRTAISLDPGTRALVGIGSPREGRVEATKQRIASFLTEHPGALATEIYAGVRGDKGTKVLALGELLGAVVMRVGTGVRGSPFRYSLREGGTDVLTQGRTKLARGGR